MTETTTARLTHGGRHGYLVDLDGGWMTVAYDCAEVETVDADDAEGYWTNPATGLSYYTTDIHLGSN